MFSIIPTPAAAPGRARAARPDTRAAWPPARRPRRL